MHTTPKRLPGPPPYVIPPGTRYVLPCPVMGLGGLYEYVLIDTPQATRWLAAGVYVSCVTHPFLAGAIEELTGRVLPPPQRRLPLLGYADDALIFQVEGYETLERQITGDSRRIRVLVDEERFTFGLLRRLG